MSRIKHIWITAVALFLSFQAESPAQSHIEKIASDQINITIQSPDTEGISMLQFTDLHLGGKDHWNDDLSTFRRIKRLVEMYDPDLIALTGDVFAGKEMAAILIRHFDELQRPWLYVFGNHDAEGDIDRDGIYELFSTSNWGILGYHNDSSVAGRKYDYCVDISLKGDPVPRWQIYGLDTGPHEGVKAIQPAQLEWYKNKSQASKDLYGTMPRAISIFHIPFIQYQYLWDDKSIPKEGESREKVWYEEDDGSTYRAFVEVGNIEACFCGHDHYNNYWGEYNGGIILSYGYISGEATNEAWPTGGKLIILPTDKGEIQIQNVVPDFDHRTSGNIEKILKEFHDPHSPYVMVAAHRAAHKEHPENSISAIEYAIELGLDIVELDVRTTSDGIPVLMHDGTIDRTTNGSGRVEDLTLSELLAFSLKNTDGTLTEETIPTFEEALEVIHGNIMVDIDLKTDHIQPIVEAVRRTGTLRSVFYFDNDYDLLEKILELEGSSMIMPRAYSCEMADSALKRFPAKVIHIDPSFYTPEVTKLIADGNARIWINALGISDAMIRQGNVEEVVNTLLQHNANIIQTDEPELLLKYLRNTPVSMDLSAAWKFSPDEKDLGSSELWYDPDFNDSQWDTIDAGLRWEDQGYPDLDSYGWYRKSIDIPGEWEGKDIWLKFGAVNDAYELFVNGESLSYFGEANISQASRPTYTKIDESLNYGESNHIAVKVNDWGNSGGLWRLPVVLTSNEDEVKGFFQPMRPTPYTPESLGYTLFWEDHFNGEHLDPEKWAPRGVGPRAAGYVSTEAISVKDGFLELAALRKGDSILVGAVGTQDLFMTRYGYFECRAQLQKSQGNWAAFWIQSTDISKGEDPAEFGVEIDIMEYFKKTGEDLISHNLHWAYGPNQKSTGGMLSEVKGVSEGFHTFSLEWTPEKYAFYVDGYKYYELSSAISHIEEYLILSMELPASTDDLKDAIFPDAFIVDYVKVYKKK